MENPHVSLHSHVDATRALQKQQKQQKRVTVACWRLTGEAETNGANYQLINSGFGWPLFQRNLKAEVQRCRLG